MKFPKLLKILIWFLAALFIVLLLTRVSLPYAVQYGFSNWFEKQGIDAHISDVSFDLTDGSLSLQGIQGTRETSQVLALDEVSVQWSWKKLLGHHVQIISIKLDGLDFGIDHNEDGNLIIAGLDIASISKAPADAPSDNKSDDASEEQDIDWMIQLDSLNLRQFNICYNNHADKNMDYCVSFNDMLWDGKISFDLARVTETVTPLFMNGAYTLEAFKLHNNKLKRDLLNLKKLSLDTVNVETVNSLNVGQITLDDFSLLQRVSDDRTQYVTDFDRLRIETLRLTELDQLSIESIEITNHQTLLLILKNKDLELTEWLPKPLDEDEQTTEKSPAEPSSEKPFAFSIGSITYKTDKATQFVDNSITEPFSVGLNNIDFGITNIDTKKPEQKSDIRYSATHDEHGKINLKGTATPLAAKPSFDITGKISGIDLRSVSAFTKETIGHSIKSGQLDADLKLIAEQSVLDSSLDLSLFHFELKALSKEDAEKLDAGLGFPLNTSLMLLKNKDNSIHLTIPITGDLENPNFEPHDVINTALTKAITAAILNFYTPYGIADTLFSLATALRFDPVNFDAGSNKPDDTAFENTNKIAELMIERPGIHITLCGFTNSADRAMLFPDTSTKKNEEEFTLDAKYKTGLSDLTNARYTALKEIFTAKKIDASRLVACEPEHEEGSELSGIEISI